MNNKLYVQPTNLSQKLTYLFNLRGFYSIRESTRTVYMDDNSDKMHLHAPKAF